MGSEENLVWITKTHYPTYGMRDEIKFTANKQIVLVRNPVDVFVSQLGLFLTSTHSLSLAGNP